jgi:hypothetical protein
MSNNDNEEEDPKRYKGSLKISFPHPFSGKSIDIKKTFGIYIIDQVKFVTNFFFA